MELLNLDELVKVKRTVQIGGCSYDVAERTVAQMIQAMNVAKRADAEDSEQILLDMVETAKNILPSCPEQKLKTLNLKQLMALLEYAMASDQEIGADEEESEGK